jgi:hypothetical protein
VASRTGVPSRGRSYPSRPGTADGSRHVIAAEVGLRRGTMMLGIQLRRSRSVGAPIMAPLPDADDYPTDAESLWRLALPTLERVYAARDQSTASARLWADVPTLRAAGYRLSAVSWVAEPAWSPAAWIGRRRWRLYATYSAPLRFAATH